MTPATSLQNQIRAATSKIGARLFPVTVGMFWAGQIVRTLPDGCIVLKNPRIVNVGTKGMSDLVGFVPHVVTEADVGKTLAVYTACEVKHGADRIRPDQQAFIDAVVKNGGRAGIARTSEDAVVICRGD